MSADTEFCICCHKNPVTWPRVCDKCQDKEAQAELFAIYCKEGEAGFEEDPSGYTEELIPWCSFYCRSCGMIYDGGMRCTYCGDPNPTGEDSEADYE